MRLGQFLVLLSALIASSPLSLARPTTEGGCIAYGDHWAFMLSPPPGWILSCAAEAEEGVPVALWPKGSNWRDAKVVMYVTPSSKSSPQETLDRFANDSDARFKVDKPGVIIRTGKQLMTTDKRIALVREFTGDPWGNFEAVAYIDSKTIFAMVVLSARDEKTYRANYAAFEKVVAGYAYMDKVEK